MPCSRWGRRSRVLDVSHHAPHVFFSPCPRGLEEVLSDELKDLGAQEITPAEGGVGFAGPFLLCYQVNLESRIASRVLWQVSHGRYRREQDLYEAARQVPWHHWFSTRRTIKVKVSAQDCPLKSLDFVTLRIKDAICDQFVAVTKARPSVDTRQPDIRIHAFLDRRSFTFYLDTSGEALFKRGLRKIGVEAPLRENLAAGILRLSGWTREQPFLDPMCGGGTLVLEAAQMACKVAPGLGRRFAFEKLNNFHPSLWQDLREASRSRQTSAPSGIYGCDRRAPALRAAQVNLEAAGLADAVTLTQIDVLDMIPPAPEGVLVTNPPYGVRTGRAADLAQLYPRLGDVLKQRFAGWCVYILTADLRLPKLIGLAPSRRLPLFNGAIECRLYEFKMVSGSMRRRDLKEA